MIRRSATAVLLCLVTLACDRDPARSVKVAARGPAEAAATPSVPAAPAAPPTTGTRVESLPAAPVPTAPPPMPAASSRGASGAAAHTAGSQAVPPAASASPRGKDWHPDACPPPPDASDANGPSRLTVSGPCAFEHRGAVSCEWSFDDFIIAASRKARDGATLMVYINVEKYTGPGNYDGAQMFVGLQDKTYIYRWWSDAVSVTVGKDEAYADLPKTVLDAEPLLVDCTGPMTNYQCAGRTESPHTNTTAVVSGRLQCLTVERAK